MDLKIAVISDVHLFHRKTGTAHILDGLYAALPMNSETAKLDAIFITGDLADRLGTLTGDDYYLYLGFLSYLAQLSSKLNIVIRVLEGTASHDWRQARALQAFKDLCEECGTGADIAYVDTLHIERHEKLGIDLLYLPDDYHHDPEVTWLDVQKKLSEHGLTQADFVLMHGQFEYQLPEHIDAPKHRSDRYSGIARKYVFCGHIHQHSYFLNIIVPGSFDRCGHGDESPKGHILLNVSDSGDEIKFIENKNAKIYKSIDVGSMSVSDAMDQIEREVKSLPDRSHVRIVAVKENPILEAINDLKSRYANIFWDKKESNGKKKSVEKLDTRSMIKTEPITPDNIGNMVMRWIENRDIDIEKSTVIETLEVLDG